MTMHHDPKNPNHDGPGAAEPLDCTEETAQRAGAEKTSLKPDDAKGAAKKRVDDVGDKDDITEAELDEALDDSMDASDPPAALQP